MSGVCFGQQCAFAVLTKAHECRVILTAHFSLFFGDDTACVSPQPLLRVLRH